MRKIDIICFAGCPVTEELILLLEKHREERNFSLHVEKVYRAEDSLEKGLFGTPTILLNGREYQQNPMNQAGVYCRIFQTKNRREPLPDIKDLVNHLDDAEKSILLCKVKEGLHYPMLLVSRKCVFTKPAKNFWTRIADESGAELRVLFEEDNQEMMEGYGAGGYPCLVVAKSRYFYGFHYSNSEAKDILLGYQDGVG